MRVTLARAVEAVRARGRAGWTFRDRANAQVAPRGGAALRQVALICITHASSTQLADFAAALPGGLAGCEYRVVVVDSGSPDDTVAQAQGALPDADVLQLDGNRGFAAGINTAVSHVRNTGGAHTYVVINPDIRLHEGCVRELLDGLDPVAGIGITAPRLVDEHGSLLFSLRRAATATATAVEAIVGGSVAHRLGLPRIVVRDPTVYTGATTSSWATGGLLAIAEQCARDVGPWDETFFLYEEEVEFCRRAAQAGYALRFVPSASATRVVGRMLRPSPWVNGLMRVNRWRHLARQGTGRAAAARWAMIVGEGVRALAGRPEARAGVWSLWHKAEPAEVVQRYRLHEGAARPSA